MGRRDRVRLQRWAFEVIRVHGGSVASLMGLEAPPDVSVRAARDGPPGSTNGRIITLSEKWFREHPDDEGCVIHELSHAYLQAPVYDVTTAWLIEGIADHIRDRLRMQMPWTSARYVPGGATAGYQSTAHFLDWLEGRCPGTLVGLCRRLADGTYAEGAFAELCQRPLRQLISAYETEMGPA